MLISQALKDKLNSLERRVDCCCNAAGGATIVEVTYEEARSLVENNTLQVGALYKITGFNKNMPSGSPENPEGNIPEVLYDDGTNPGITIYVHALSTNTLSTDGWGEFYNPKYILDINEYNNTDGTGLYGIWDGDNPEPTDVPTYVQDQVVFWGGYAWKNLTGNVGYADNSLALNSEDWEKLPYTDNTVYDRVHDEIKVDWINQILTERYNSASDIRVTVNQLQYYDNYQEGTNYIAYIPWGLSDVNALRENGDYAGLYGVTVTGDIVDLINFKGEYIIDLNVNHSTMYSNYFGKYSSLKFNTLDQYSAFDYNTLTSDSRFSYNALSSSYFSSNTLSDSSFDSNTLTSHSSFNSNDLSSSTFGSNTLTDSYFNYNDLSNSVSISNTLTNYSSFYYNDLTSGFFNYNTLTNSYFSYNTLTNSYFSYNTLMSSSYFSSNTLTSDSFFSYNDLSSNSSFDSNTLTSSNFISNDLSSDSSFNSNTLSGGSSFNINSLSASSFGENTLGGSSFSENTLSSGSSFSNNTSSSGGFSNNSLSSDSSFSDNTLTNGSFNHNTLSSGSTITGSLIVESAVIEYNTLNNAANFENNELAGTNISYNTIHRSRIEGCSLEGSEISDCILDSSEMSFIGVSITVQNISIVNDSSLQFIVPMTSVVFDSISMDKSSLTQNDPSTPLSNVVFRKIFAQGIEFSSSNFHTATNIYLQNPTKELFSNANNIPRLKYYDNTDTVVISNIDA